MKFKTIIDASHEEEVLIYAHSRCRLVDDIERLLLEDDIDLIGYKDKMAVRLDIANVYCFVSENNRVYAKTQTDKLMLKNRLYQLEEVLPQNFIKINQSCIANLRQIKKFDASFSGTLRAIFKNDDIDYVSRRNLKKVKERLGL